MVPLRSGLGLRYGTIMVLLRSIMVYIILYTRVSIALHVYRLIQLFRCFGMRKTCIIDIQLYYTNHIRRTKQCLTQILTGIAI